MTTHEDVLATVDAARARTRRAKRAGWIPLSVFGVVCGLASLFHLRALALYDASAPPAGVTSVPPSTFWPSDGGRALHWYLQIAIPVGYVLVAALYALRQRRAGVRSPLRAYVVTGVLLVVAVFYFDQSLAWQLPWSSFLAFHGLEATITIGPALLVLAWLERSVTLAVAAAVVTAAALTASLYDIENQWYQLFGLIPSDGLAAVTNDLALSAMLLLCAAVVWFVDRRRNRRALAA